MECRYILSSELKLDVRVRICTLFGQAASNFEQLEELMSTPLSSLNPSTIMRPKQTELYVTGQVFTEGLFSVLQLGPQKVS